MAGRFVRSSKYRASEDAAHRMYLLTLGKGMSLGGLHERNNAMIISEYPKMPGTPT